MDRNREYILAGLLVALTALSALVLWAVLQTVVFAITVAYVAFPLKRWLTRRRFSDRIASAITTVGVFLVVGLIFAPLVAMLYQRREQLIGFLQTLPDSVSLSTGGFQFVIETGPLISSAIDSIRGVAVEFAVAAPGLTLQLGLFALLLYGLLYKPGAIREAILGATPPEYHDILTRLHGRTRRTLFSLYILQIATAFGTFLIALVLFFFLGYQGALSLAAIAGILQFVPILGPSLLVIALTVSDLLVGNLPRALVVLTAGLFLIAFLPDAVIRTKLSGTTGEIAPSLYFVGFVGGILTIGPLGIIIGPLVVGLLLEAVALLADNTNH